MSARPIPETVTRHWDYVRESGREPKPVYILRALPGNGEQPPGYPKGWSVRRVDAERQRLRQWNPELWEIEKVEP